MKKVYSIFLAVVFCIACQRPIVNQTEKDIVTNDVEADSSLIKKDEHYRVDVIKYTYYNSIDTIVIDSIKLYYADTNTIESIEYRPKEETIDNKWIKSIHYYKIGKVKRITYDYERFSKGDTIQIFWHPNDTISTIDIYQKDNVDHPWMQYSYYPNGILSEEGIYDIYPENQTIVPCGLWNYYDSLGVLIKTKYFHNDVIGKDYILEKSYNKIGKVISNKIYNNGALYETGELIEFKQIP